VNKPKLIIEGPYENRTVTVEEEITIGRTTAADVVVDDHGLSRVNTTFFFDDGELWVADEGSTNGTFVNGEKVVGRPRILRDGDSVTLGSSTTIRVEIGGSVSPFSQDRVAPAQATESVPQPEPVYTPPSEERKVGMDQMHMLAIAAGILTVVIILCGGIAFFLVDDGGGSAGPGTVSGQTIPQRVIDPLGGEDENDLMDLIASWEVAEEEIVADEVGDIKGAEVEEEGFDLNVSAAFLADRQRLAMAPRTGPTGIRPAGLNVPRELFGDGVIKQTRKLREMREGGYKQPMDFGDLAEKRLSGELVELPMATESFYLDVGGSAQTLPFSSFAFPNNRSEIIPGHPKYDTMKRLADNFAGQKYDLNDPADRRQMRIRLLRMFHPRARPILKELADHYYAKYQRPLRVTSLTRSMDYQILLNQGNPNSYVVRGEGALPPHTSGCAFDLARKHMTAEEQNYVMEKLAQMERENKLDALIEYGLNACFHVFIYHDGNPPRGFNYRPELYDSFPFLTSVVNDDDGHRH
jgi:pSer/pThr/pTyr-binding forkhead associated (FHA) protein